MNGWLKGKKCAYLENLSTSTSIQLFRSDCRNLVAKSRLTVCHAWLGTGNGRRRPGYFARSDLACWHVILDCTNSLTSFFILGQVKVALSLLYITGKPECPPTGLSCNATMTVCCSSVFDPNHILPLNRITPLTRLYCSWMPHVVSNCNILWATWSFSYLEPLATAK